MINEIIKNALLKLEENKDDLANIECINFNSLFDKYRYGDINEIYLKVNKSLSNKLKEMKLNNKYKVSTFNKESIKIEKL